MSTLIAVYNQAGSLGRCDEYCYNDVDVGCTCLCNGINHGVGFQQALINTARECAFWASADNFGPHTSPPTAVRLHPEIRKIQRHQAARKNPQ